MNEEYYHWIGKIMLKSWSKYFSKDFKLHLYLEDFLLDFKDERFIIHSWHDDMIPKLNLWQTHRKSSLDNKGRSEKFTKKAMAQISTWNKIKGKFLWLDADLVFLNNFNQEKFDEIIENFPLASWGNGKFESGTVFINLDHPDWPKIKEIYESIYFGKIPFPKGDNKNTDRYYPGTNRLIYPTGWLDGEILGYSCVKSQVDYRNLNSLCRNNSNTPLNDSPLGKIMHHMKAKRKNNAQETLTKMNRKDLLDFFRN
jgi:hypothetical protein